MRWIRHPGRALDAYIDGELESAAALRVEDHLDRCRMCRQRLVMTVRVRRVLEVMFDPR